MMSRGLSKETAKDLYIKGLVEPFVDQILTPNYVKIQLSHLWGDLNERQRIKNNLVSLKIINIHYLDSAATTLKLIKL